MSMAPTCTPAPLASAFTIRCASVTPRRWIPTNATCPEAMSIRPFTKEIMEATAASIFAAGMVVRTTGGLLGSLAMLNSDPRGRAAVARLHALDARLEAGVAEGLGRDVISEMHVFEFYFFYALIGA